MRDYRLACTACNEVYIDDGARLTCSHEHGPALLRSVYDTRAFTVSDATSMLRYERWLPNAREIETSARTGVYRSTALGGYLGLRQLYIAFSGWRPQRGATLPTGTFKDLEAVSVLRRLAPGDARTLVIASAGNTALAFARACTDNALPALIVLPLSGWREVMATTEVGATVRVVAIADGEYEDAIGFARRLCVSDEYILEGGVRNVGRRDGMGTAMLAAVEAIGTLPDCYFQAVGSAAGALAAHEAALRLIADGRFGTRLPRLMLSQNAPFSPIHDAWQAGTGQLVARSEDVARRQLDQLGARVLSNLAPPYAQPGGIHEALAASNGRTYAISTAELGNAMALFAELEDVSIEPAAGVAVAALIHAARRAEVEAEDRIVLHITGGGRRELPSAAARPARPTLILKRDELATTAIDRTRSLLR